ncbi:MAG: hypothetical protein V3U45_06560 [bacterium]
MPTSEAEAMALGFAPFRRGGPPEMRRRTVQYRPPESTGARSDLAFILKTCPKCLGDLVLRRGIGAEFFVCLQCGVKLETKLTKAAEPYRRTPAA